MKYIKLFETFSIDKTEIAYELDQYGIQNYTINDDGIVDVEGSVDLSGKLFRLYKLPFNFGKVIGNFDCSDNHLESLEGSPYEVSGDFDCSTNYLIDLKGSPVEVGGSFICSYNKLESLDGMPLEIGKDFGLDQNKTLNSVDSISNIEGILFCDPHMDITKFRGYCKEIDNS